MAGTGPADEHRAEVAAARAKVQQRIVDAVEGLVFVKTHQAIVIDREHPTINFAAAASGDLRDAL